MSITPVSTDMTLHKALTNYSIKPSPSGVLYVTIDQIKRANREAGFFFFSPSTMRFFSSRVCDTTHCGKGGVYFVTSEQFRGDRSLRITGKPRAYTVRKFNPETCDIDTASEFNNLSRYRAHKLAHSLAQGEQNEKVS